MFTKSHLHCSYGSIYLIFNFIPTQTLLQIQVKCAENAIASENSWHPHSKKKIKKNSSSPVENVALMNLRLFKATLVHHLVSN